MTCAIPGLPRDLFEKARPRIRCGACVIFRQGVVIFRDLPPVNRAV